MKLMYDNLVVAIPFKEFNETLLKLVEGLPISFVPEDLFLDKDSVSLYEVLDWASRRIFPEERTDLKRQLTLLGLEDYNTIKIIRKTKACLIEDGWWLSFSEEDDWRVDTTRGRAGFPEWDPQTFTLKK